MARAHAHLKSSVWEPGSEFRALTPIAQWAYVMLLSQPQISNLGILPFTPEKWARLADGLTVPQLAAAIGELERGYFILVDRETAELLVRTFIKHDKVYTQPKLVTNARKLIREVESDEIRDLLTGRHPWLVGTWSRPEIEAHETPPDTPTERGIPEPSTGEENPVDNSPQKGVSEPLSQKQASRTGARGKGLRTSLAVVPEASASSPPSQPSPPNDDEQGGHDPYGSTNHPRELALLHIACGATPDALTKLKRGSKSASVADLVAAREAATGPGVRDRLAVALAELKGRRDAATSQRTTEATTAAGARP